MGKVIDATNELPLLKGDSVCLNCGWEGEMSAFLGSINLTCPQCKLQKAVFTHLFSPELPIWECECGNDHWLLTDAGPTCSLCGSSYDFCDYLDEV